MKLNLVKNFLFSAMASLLTFGAVQIVAADYQSTVLSKGPLAYWRLGETTAVPGTPDIIANAGSLGTAGNGYPGPDVIKAQPGVVGSSCSFTNPGAGFDFNPNSIVDVPYAAALNPNGPFTIEFWANPNDHANDLVAVVSSLNLNQSRSGYLVYHDAPNKRWEFRVGGTASYAATIDSPNNSVQPGTWYHVVGVYDGVNVLLYVDGQLVAGPKAANGGAGYNPNNSQPFRIGATQFPNRSFDGLVDEVAFYGSALSASVIAAHHDAGLNNQAGYPALIQTANPALFLHLDEPVYTPPDPSTLPVTANSGTVGAAANGTNYPGVTAGVAGPAFSGFGADNRGLQLTGVGGNVAIGNPAGLNFAGPITLIAWIKPKFADGLRNIISHGYRLDPNQEVQMRINGGTYEVGSWEPAEGATAPADVATGDIGNWVFLAGTFDGANWNLYRYDSLIATGTGSAGSLSMDAPWSIGSRGDASVDPLFFGGGIDEVAIFNAALSANDLKEIYYSANPLLITKQPQAPAGAVFETTTVTLSVVAEGTPPLAYQWTKNTSPVAGQTGSSLVLNNVSVGDSGNYAVIVSNPTASPVTSSIVALTVTAPPPQFTLQPKPATRYVGATAIFSVTATGAQLSYQWKYNDTTVIAGANSASFTVSPVSLASAGNYKCTVTNPNGSSDSTSAALTVLPAPTGYGATIVADNPVAYWRLGETSGSVAHDYWGGHDGQYNNVTLGLPGFSVVDSDKAVGFTAVDTYLGGISGFDFTGDNSTFSLEAWANGSGSQVSGAAIIAKGRGGNGGGGVNGWQYVLDVTGGFFRFHVETTSGNAADATATVGPDGTWQHVVGVYDGPGGAMHIYVNGLESGTGSPPSGGPLATGLAVNIGAGQGGVTPIHDLFFNGSIDEAAIYNQALSADQVLTHFNGVYGSNTAPIIFQQPVSATNYATRTVTLKAVAGGSPTLSYQWKKGTANVPGATSPLLTLGPLVASDAGDYKVVVSNLVGTNTSSTATVTVLAIPTAAIATPGLVLHLPFDDNYSDTSSRNNNGTAVGAPTFSDGKIGTKALHYSTLTVDGTDATAVTASNYVTLGVRPDLQFGPNVNFSVAYWVKLPENTMPGDLPFIANNSSSYGGPGYTFAPSFEEGGWSWYINNKTAGAFGGIGLYSPQMNNINDGAWHHLAHTFDRTGNAITYLDGVSVDVTPIAAGAAWDLGTANPTDIGQAGGAYAEPAESDIDDIGMWSRVLTPVEVDGIYLGGNVNGVSFTNAPTSMQPTLAVSASGNQLTISWSPPGGTLEQAGSLLGPWNSLGTVNPQKVTIADPASFLRVHVP